jgi:murein DD-endopeptidase MepM/ murein hydrolase activator NlpD
MIEALESRTLLAANLWVTDSYFTDADGHSLNPPAVGARVFEQVEFRTQDLPANAQYIIRFQLDNVILSTGPLTWGAGHTFVESWVARWGPFLVGPGPHTAQVFLDATNNVAESNELDNVRTWSVTPVTFQSLYGGDTRFITPLAGTPYQNWSIVNYVDLDPGSGVRDYAGGNYTYDGHNGIDMTLPNFAAMDAGVPVYAAAGGVVVIAQDGYFDRNVCPGNPCDLTGVNYVAIDHGNGWRTFYYHLRRSSVAVSVGDVVRAGDVLGLAGSSGNSSDAHLHFEVQHRGVVVETYVAPSAYWVSPLPYSGNVPGVLDHGTTDHSPTLAELKDRPATRAAFPVLPGQTVYFWALLHGIGAGDQLSVVWRRPDGSAYFAPAPYTPGQIGYGWQIQAVNLPAVPDPGLWRVEFRRNNVVIAQDTFWVGANLAGQIQFNTTGYTVTENGGSARITVTRTSPLGTVSVHYATSDVTAHAGTDYLAQSGDLTFGPGQLVRTFTVPILNDSLHANTRRFRLTLSNPTGGATLGPQSLANVDIIDNDALLRFTVTPNLVPNLLTVNGDTQQVHDVITLDLAGAYFRVNVNGDIRLFPLSQTTAVTVNAGVGNDTINVEQTAAGKPVTVNAGDGNDTVNLSPAAHNLGNLHGDVIANAGAGVDALNVYDEANASDGSVYQLTGTTVRRTGTGLFTYQLFNAGLVLRGGSGNNTVFDVGGTHSWSSTLYSGPGSNTVNVRASGGPLTVNGQGGLDVVHVGDAGRVQNLWGALTVVNPPVGGYTALTVDDAADATARTATLSINGPTAAITGLAPTPITYAVSDVRSVTVNGGSGGNTFNVLDTAANSFPVTTTLNSGSGSDTVNVRATTGALTINAGAGDDTVLVGNGGLSLGSITGPLSVDGQGGTDVLTVTDESASGGHDYTITAASVTRSGMPFPLTYASTETLRLIGGNYGNTINVTSTAAGTDTRIHAGDGAGTVTVGNGGLSLSSIAGTLTVHGDNGANVLRVTDQSATGAHTYDLTADYLDRSGAARISYDSLQALELTASNQSDTITVWGTAAGTATTVEAGDGDDTITMAGGGIAGTLTLDGQGGSNTVDYSAYSTDVVVVLPLGQATDVAGGLSNIQNVAGGNGGPAGSYNLLVGAGGNYLQGGTGRRNILIAGYAAGTLVGGDDEDLLIGGSTTYDTDLASLLAIAAEWARADEDYDTRVFNLSTGADVPLLDATTVFGNGGGNGLYGGAGRDWFFGNPDLDLHDWDPTSEVFTPV